MALQRICDPMLPELSRVFDAPISAVSQVISWFAITYGLMQLFYGPVGDRFGKYRVVMLATLGCSVGCVLSALSTHLDFLVSARVATALAADLALAKGQAVQRTQRRNACPRACG